MHSWLTAVGRDLAISGGWYEPRREFQVVLIGAITVIGVTALLNAALLLRRVWWRVAGAFLGLGLLMIFVLVRAASFHHIDAILSLSTTLVGIGTIRLHSALELSGIALIALSASSQGNLRQIQHAPR